MQQHILPGYLAISSTRQEISNTVKRKTLFGCFFRTQEMNEINSVAEHQ